MRRGQSTYCVLGAVLGSGVLTLAVRGRFGDGDSGRLAVCIRWWRRLEETKKGVTIGLGTCRKED